MKNSSLKIALAQMNPTVGDYAGNAAKIISWIGEADRQGADLIVFPEGALCGYPVWDLANKKVFVDAGLRELRRIAAATGGKKIAAVLGFIDNGAWHHFQKKRCQAPLFYNAAAWLEAGRIRAVYHKQLLPTYDVFLEEIFFRPGAATKVVPFRGHKVGLTICEDIWDERYDVKPLAALAKKKADLVVNISASPYYEGVAASRERLLKSQVRRYGFPVLYVNQVGGQDDLLFDGRSMFMDAKGRTLFQAPAFEEGLFFLDQPPCTHRVCTRVPHPVCTGSGETAEMYQALTMGVRDYFRKNGFKKAVIGLSGGIDSALVACIAVDALGKDAVKGVTMPGPYSSEGSWKDSRELAKNLGIGFEVRPIKKMYATFLKSSVHGPWTIDPGPSLAMENLQARLRGMELMFLSNDEGRLVLTTGNKSELAMGYCTLYGDMAGGLAVIGDVYKTDVYRLARFRNTLQRVIPGPILTKAPSAELRPNQKDQDSLPPYEILDAILRLYIEKNLGREEIARRLSSARHCEPRQRRGEAIASCSIPQNDKLRERHGLEGRPRDDRKKVSPSLITAITRKVDHNEYKRRQTPPILRVTEKAWFGRRMPITNRFLG